MDKLEFQKLIEKQMEVKSSIDELDNKLKSETKEILSTLKDIEKKFKPEIKDKKTEMEKIRKIVIDEINNNPAEYLKGGKTKRFFDFTVSITETKKAEIKKKWKLLFALKNLGKLDLVDLKFDETQLVELLKLDMIDLDIAEIKSVYNYRVVKTNE